MTPDLDALAETHYLAAVARDPVAGMTVSDAKALARAAGAATCTELMACLGDFLSNRCPIDQVQGANAVKPLIAALQTELGGGSK